MEWRQAQIRNDSAHHNAVIPPLAYLADSNGATNPGPQGHLCAGELHAPNDPLPHYPSATVKSFTMPFKGFRLPSLRRTFPMPIHRPDSLYCCTCGPPPFHARGLVPKLHLNSLHVNQSACRSVACIHVARPGARISQSGAWSFLSIRLPPSRDLVCRSVFSSPKLHMFQI